MRVWGTLCHWGKQTACSKVVSPLSEVKYNKYTPEERAKNGTENLPAKAARHFSQLS